MNKVFIPINRYLPGFRAGGPPVSISNLASQLGDHFDFNIFTLDRDVYDSNPYPGIRPNCWNKVGKSSVFYTVMNLLLPFRLFKTMKAGYSLLYIQSFFNPIFSLLPLLFHVLLFGSHKPVVLAPRGELTPGALSLKSFQKLLYLKLFRLLINFSCITFHATSSEEAEYISSYLSVDVANIIVARNLLSLPIHSSGISEKKIYGDGSRHYPLKIAFVSRITPKKNLLFALHLLSDIDLFVKFIVYGPVRDKDYWDTCTVTASLLPDNVDFQYGGDLARDQVLGVLFHSDFLLFPTLGENFGHIIAESLSVGTPVILSEDTPWKQSLDYAISVVNDFDRRHWLDIIRTFASLSASARKAATVESLLIYSNLANEDLVLSSYHQMLSNSKS